MERIISKDRPYKLFAFLLGVVSTISQVVLLRELVTVFYGNETAYAIIFASWLFWVACGSFFFSNVIRKIKSPLFWFLIVQIMLFLMIPATLILIRCIHPLMNIHIGEIVGIISMGGITFIILAPITFLFGVTFVLICHLPLILNKDDRNIEQVGKIYFWESLGSAFGGVVFSFILIKLLSAIYIVFFIGIINLIIIFLLVQKKKIYNKLIVLIIFIAFIFVFLGFIIKIDSWSRKQQWRGFDLVFVKDSIYGNIAITKVDQEYSLFENGLLSFSTRDSLSSEELVHYALSSHFSPKKVLLVGNGLDGSIEELLKYNNLRIDYVQLDPEIVDLTKKYFPNKYTHFLKDKRVKVFYEDARFFVKSSKKKYDVILVNLPDPITAVINRYYSLEFFQETKRILNEGGIVALSVSSSENYLSTENRAFLCSINSTLKHVFEDVKSIPGSDNIFLASNIKDVVLRDANILISRIKSRGLSLKYVDAYHIPYKLSEDRLGYIDNVLNKEGLINTDIKPVAYFYDIVLWSTHFNKVYKKFIEKFLWINIYYLLLIPLMITLLGKLFFSRDIKNPIIFSVVSTGFSEIIYQIIVIISFQTLHGYAYYRIGLIIASFMLGLSFGSLKAKKVIRSGKDILHFYKIIQFNIALYPIVLIAVYYFCKGSPQIFILRNIFSLIFTFLPFLAGFMGGIQYPLAIKLMSSFDHNKNVSKLAGFLYAADIFGASVGAIISAVFLIPLIGINSIAVFIALLNFSVFIWLNLVKKS